MTKRRGFVGSSLVSIKSGLLNAPLPVCSTDQPFCSADKIRLFEDFEWYLQRTAQNQKKIQVYFQHRSYAVKKADHKVIGFLTFHCKFSNRNIYGNAHGLFWIRFLAAEKCSASADRV